MYCQHWPQWNYREWESTAALKFIGLAYSGLNAHLNKEAELRACLFTIKPPGNKKVFAYSHFFNIFNNHNKISVLRPEIKIKIQCKIKICNSKYAIHICYMLIHIKYLYISVIQAFDKQISGNKKILIESFFLYFILISIIYKFSIFMAGIKCT